MTALNPVIGYEKGAAIAKKAYAEGRPIREVAAEMTDLPREQLAKLLDPAELTTGGIKGGGGGRLKARRRGDAGCTIGQRQPRAAAPAARDWAAIIRARLAGTQPRHEPQEWLLPVTWEPARRATTSCSPASRCRRRCSCRWSSGAS